jgi:hypothetical protein
VVITMKQGNTSVGMIDLDDLERQLNAAASPRKAAGDDPLAELARIVGRDDSQSGSKIASKLASQETGNTAVQRVGTSFDDFLKIPPRPASGVMPSHTPPVEPLFPEIIPQKKQDEIRDPSMNLADFDELQLRTEIEDPLQEDSLSEGALSEEEALQELAAEREVFAGNADFDDLEVSPELTAKPKTAELAVASSLPPHVQKDNFDDMLAEFEAAMKDVGAEKAIPASIPSLAPIVIPPPPAELSNSQPSTSSIPSSIGMGAIAAGTMVAGGLAASALTVGPAAQEQTFNIAGADQDKRSKKRRGMMLAGGVLGVALIGIASLVTSGSVSKQVVGSNAPTIAAKPGVTKERPVNPGGVEVPNQDKEVLQTKVVEPKAPERVAPREEQPVDLTQAQRLAQNQQLVRQIPGVAIVAPISTTPPAAASAPVAGASPSVAGSQPVPRPVASVPISIAGQPAPAVAPITAAPAPVAAPILPPAARPVVNAPATPSSSAPVKAPDTASQPPAAAAEPRRVRAVPIRSETADAAPSRSQAQPRVVPANPNRLTAEEPDAANAPLRITPQANRAPVRVATAQPATTPSQTAAPATGGSGFAVQLAAEGSEDAARSKFNRVKSQHSEVLGSYSPNIRSAEVNGRSVYRVRVGSLSREEATGLCERLKASGGNCFVAKN